MFSQMYSYYIYISFHNHIQTAVPGDHNKFDNFHDDHSYHLHQHNSVLIHLLDPAESIQEQKLEDIFNTIMHSREIDLAARAHDPG